MHHEEERIQIRGKHIGNDVKLCLDMQQIPLTLAWRRSSHIVRLIVFPGTVS